MAPAPIIASVLGAVLAASASREVITRTPSTGKPGKALGFCPVQSRIFWVRKNLPRCSPEVISTMPGMVTEPWPTK